MYTSRLMAVVAAAILTAGGTPPQTPKSTAKPVSKAPLGRGAVVAQAHADIKGEGITGTADFTEQKIGTVTTVEIGLTAKGLKPGFHGVHLHAVGTCEPDFAAAGGHFDPGPAGNMDPDSGTFAVVRDLSDQVVLVTESSIQLAMRGLFEHERLVAEGAAATGVGALLQGGLGLAGRKVAVILTGRNVDAGAVRAILASSSPV